MTVDWHEIRRNRWSRDRPPEWPEDVKGISMKGVGLFGLDTDGRLYWDGKEVLVRRKLRLATFERIVSAAIAFGTIAAASAAWYAILYRPS